MTAFIMRVAWRYACTEKLVGSLTKREIPKKHPAEDVLEYIWKGLDDYSWEAYRKYSCMCKSLDQ